MRIYAYIYMCVCVCVCVYYDVYNTQYMFTKSGLISTHTYIHKEIIKLYDTWNYAYNYYYFFIKRQRGEREGEMAKRGKGTNVKICAMTDTIGL